MAWNKSVLLTALAAFAPHASAQSFACTFDDIVARWDVDTNRRYQHIDVEDGLAVAIADRELLVLDVTDPSDPQLLGQHQGNAYLRRVDIAGTLAFCAASADGLLIYDISDPSAPSLLSQTVVYSYADDVQVANELVYACWSVRGLRAFDFSDPANPVELGVFNPQEGYLDELSVDGDLAILTSVGDAWIIDVSDPANMTELAHLDLANAALTDAQIVGNHAYLTFETSGLEIWDLTDPTTPLKIGATELPGRSSQISVVGDTATVGFQSRGCAVVDVSDPAAPLLIGLYDPQGDIWGMYTDGHFAYFASILGIEIFDISDPPTPATLIEREVPPDGRDIAIHGSHAFVASQDDGLTIFDITNPIDPQPVGSYQSDRSGALIERVHCQDERAYVASGRAGVEILDISDPANPSFMSSIGSTALDVHIDGHLAYIAHSGAELWIYDISDETSPILLSRTRGGGMCVDVHNGYAYTGWSGLTIMDVSDPANPVVIAQDYTGTEMEDLVYRDGYLFAAYRVGALIYDVSEPSNPILIAERFSPLYYQRSVDLQGDLLWVGGDGGTSVFDISRPESPSFVGSISPGERLGCVQVHDDHLFFLEQFDSGTTNSLFVMNVAPCDPCPADFDANGTVDTRDFIAFLSTWATERTQDCSSGDCQTDFDNNGVVDTRDFVEFLNAFAAGC